MNAMPATQAVGEHQAEGNCPSELGHLVVGSRPPSEVWGGVCAAVLFTAYYEASSRPAAGGWLHNTTFYLLCNRFP